MTIKVGYLPLYIKLYDDENPAWRDPMVANMERIIRELKNRGLEVIRTGVCRVKEEFEAAVEQLNDAGVTAVITQHLAYSPSLESIGAVLKLKAPIIILDTTVDYNIAELQFREDCIMNNHGIHGVQDFTNLLKRNGRPYTLAVGHAFQSDVLDEVAEYARAAKAAEAFRTIRVGSVGGSFEGMGDFLVDDRTMEALTSAKTVYLSEAEGKRYEEAVTKAELDEEEAIDRRSYVFEVTDHEAYRAALKSGLALRHWAKDQELDAMTVNFLKTASAGLTTMPFMEISKAMERGVGYAGEGDKLTAALAGALMKAFPNQVTFTEMFCPDWKEDLILLSHMGECNPALAAWKPILHDTGFSYNQYGKTAALYMGLKPGKAVFMNLQPDEKRMKLVVAPVEMTDRGSAENVYRYAIQGWMKPPMALRQFLKAFSELGGTHHSVLVYGVSADTMAAFGSMMGFETVLLR